MTPIYRDTDSEVLYLVPVPLQNSLVISNDNVRASGIQSIMITPNVRL